MARTGRPKTEDAAKLKTGVLTIRLSPEERALIDSAAQGSGKAPSKWAREILLASASQKS